MVYGKKIMSNIWYFFLDTAVVTVASYIFWIAMGKLLSVENYGILTAIIAAYYILIYFVTFGMHEAVPKFVSELIKRGQPAQARGIIKYALKLSFAASSAFLLIILFLAETISKIFYGSAAMTTSLQLVAVLLFVAALASVIKSALAGLQKFKLMFLADTVGSAVKIFSAIGLVFFSLAVLGALTAWILFFVVVAVICIFPIMKYLSTAARFDKKKFLSFSGLSLFSYLSYYIILQGGVVVLAALAGARAAAYFGVAILFGQVLLLVPQVLIGALFPNLSELWVREKAKTTRLLLTAVKFSILVVLPFTIIFAFAAPGMIKLFYTTAYLEAAEIFPAFMFGSFLLGISMILLIAIYAANRPKGRLAIIGSGSVVNVVLCFLLIPAFGIQGAALAYTTAQITILISALIYVNRFMSITFSKNSLWIIPLSALVYILLSFTLSVPYLLIKVGLLIAILTAYTLSLFVTGIVSKSDLQLLDYIPDIFGLKHIKQLIKTLTVS